MEPSEIELLIRVADAVEELLVWVRMVGISEIVFAFFVRVMFGIGFIGGNSGDGI
jgi:hypothetical protein